MSKIDVEKTRQQQQTAEELAEQVATLTARAESAETALAKEKGDREASEALLAEANERAEKAEQKVAEQERELASLREQVEAANASTAASDLEAANATIEEKSAEITRLASELETANGEITRLKTELETAQTEVTRATGELNELNEKHTALKSQVENLDQHLQVKGEQPVVEDAADRPEEKETSPTDHPDYKRYQALKRSRDPKDQHEAILLAANNKHVQAGIAAEVGDISPTEAVEDTREAGVISEEDKAKWESYQADRKRQRELEGKFSLLTLTQSTELATLQDKNIRVMSQNAELFTRCAAEFGA